MPQIISDVVDAYLFRRVNTRVQFLVLRRHPDVPMGDTWQSIHAQISTGETAFEAALREIEGATGLRPGKFYSADFVSQFYDYSTDSIVLAPTFACQVAPRSRPTISEQYIDYAWCDLEETTARLPITTQRWAVRHIYDVIVHGGEEAGFYEVPLSLPGSRLAAFGRGDKV